MVLHSTNTTIDIHILLTLAVLDTDTVLGLAGRQRSADLFHWSAMEFMGHWRQRLSVALGRGRARCLEAAAVVAATWDVDPASEHSRFGF